MADLIERWHKTKLEIDTVIMNEKLIPSYFLKGNAEDVWFESDEDENGKNYFVSPHYDGAVAAGRFAFLRRPARVSLTDYEFRFACDSPTAPLDDIPFDTWYEFYEPITSYNQEIVFLRSQVERFEQIYIPALLPENTALPSLYPWGDHNTRLLQRLSDAATALWSRYDPLDPSTAPTNEQVRDWLMERNVPKRVAQTMATILRADGLKAGRRKL